MLRVGERIGDWVVGASTYEGAATAEYVGHHALSPRIEVDIRVAHPPEWNAARERFIRAMEPLLLSRHEGLVRVLGWGELPERGLLWAASERVPGRQLSLRLAEGPMSMTEAASVFGPVALTLSHVHQGRHRHGDLRPPDILLAEDGSVRLISFGGVFREDRRADGLDAESLAYAGPESLEDPHAGGTTAGDIHALGLILYEALTGRRAFPVDPSLPPARRIARLTALKMRQGGLDPGEDLPRGLRDVVIAATDPDPARRPGDAARIAEALSPLPAADAPSGSPFGEEFDVPVPGHVTLGPPPEDVSESFQAPDTPPSRPEVPPPTRFTSAQPGSSSTVSHRPPRSAWETFPPEEPATPYVPPKPGGAGLAPSEAWTPEPPDVVPSPLEAPVLSPLVLPEPTRLPIRPPPLVAPPEDVDALAPEAEKALLDAAPVLPPPASRSARHVDTVDGPYSVPPGQIVSEPRPVAGRDEWHWEASEPSSFLEEEAPRRPAGRPLAVTLVMWGAPLVAIVVLGVLIWQTLSHREALVLTPSEPEVSLPVAEAQVPEAGGEALPETPLVAESPPEPVEEPGQANAVVRTAPASYRPRVSSDEQPPPVHASPILEEPEVLPTASSIDRPAEPPDEAPPDETPETPVAEPPVPAPTSAVAYLKDGWSALDTRDFAAARVAFQEALEIEPTSGGAHYGLGQVAERTKDFQTAIFHYSRALALAGSNAGMRAEVQASLSRVSAAQPTQTPPAKQERLEDAFRRDARDE